MTGESNIYTFFGKVFPERANVNISPITLNLSNKEAGINGTLKTSIIASQISAQYHPKQKIENIYTLKNYVEGAIRLQVDVLGYSLSCGYDIEITTMVDSLRNTTEVFGVNFDNIEEFQKKRPKKFNEIMDVFSNEKGNYLILCLSDLREAIRSPKDTGFFCYRGIEDLRQFFVYETGSNDEKESWIKLREELGVERDQIDYVKRFADPVRHGGTIYISPENQKKILEITWDIVDKYILFACNGYKK